MWHLQYVGSFIMLNDCRINVVIWYNTHIMLTQKENNLQSSNGVDEWADIIKIWHVDNSHFDPYTTRNVG